MHQSLQCEQKRNGILLIRWRASMKLPAGSDFEVVFVVKTGSEYGRFYSVEVERPFDSDTGYCYRNTCTLLFSAIYTYVN